MAKDPRVSPRTAALAEMVGSVRFAGGLASLTTLEHDFLLEVDWEPLRGLSDAWPSGLSLGPYGWA